MAVAYTSSTQEPVAVFFVVGGFFYVFRGVFLCRLRRVFCSSEECSSRLRKIAGGADITFRPTEALLCCAVQLYCRAVLLCRAAVLFCTVLYCCALLIAAVLCCCGVLLHAVLYCCALVCCAVLLCCAVLCCIAVLRCSLCLLCCTYGLPWPFP